MTEASPDLHADYTAAWKARPWGERTELRVAAMKGQRARNREDAALSLWWIQDELRSGLRSTLLWTIATVVALFLLVWALSGGEPPGITEVLRWNPFLPLFVLVPFWSTFRRRPRLRAAAQLNAAVLAGETFNSPPDPEEAERLLRRARKEGWFRGTRPEQPLGGR